jgi:hypothetical protein
MHSPHDKHEEGTRGVRRYDAPELVEYGNIVAITRNSLGGQTVDGFGDPPDADDPAYASS